MDMDISKRYKGTLERSFERKYKIYELLVFLEMGNYAVYEGNNLFLIL